MASHPRFTILTTVKKLSKFSLHADCIRVRYFSPIYQTLCLVFKPMMSVDAPRVAVQGVPFHVRWVPSLPPSLDSHPPVWDGSNSALPPVILSSLLGCSISPTLAVGLAHLLRGSYVVGRLDWTGHAPWRKGYWSFCVSCPGGHMTLLT